MFAYTRKARSAEDLRARHFNFRERRTLDWSANCAKLMSASVAAGALCKLLGQPGALTGIALSLLVMALMQQDTPEADTPLWQSRLMLASAVLFYLGLGYCLGLLGLPFLAATLLVQRLLQ